MSLLQYKRSVIEGTVHRVFRSTSIWLDYDKAMEINSKQWLDKLYLSNDIKAIVPESKNSG